MGAMWYNQNLTWGVTDYCTSTPDINSRVGCFFESGMRAYFTLEYSGTGDGLIFALINGQLNQLASAGGDFEATELLGYAGDSRTNNSGGFLDTTGLKGLRPPKMGLEFDAKRNWDATFEAKPTDFCSGSSLKQNTRNDPEPGSATKDFVQYVYWGNDVVNVPCRTTPTDRSSTYDDNRHNPGGTPASDWFLSLSGVVNTSAAVSADGKTIYVASNTRDTNPTSGRLYAIELDAQGSPLAGSGTPFFVGSNGVTSPVLDSIGNIYVGAGNTLYVHRPNRTLKFSYTLPQGNRASKPVIGPDGTIYVSAYDGVKFGYLYAIRPDGSLNPNWPTNPQILQFFTTDPVLTVDGSLVIAATDAQRVFALRASDGLPDTNWGLTGAFLAAGPKNAPGVGPGATAKGTVYVGAGDRRVYALNGVDGSTLLTSPIIASEGLATQPVVAGGTVYVGSYDDNLYALDTSNLSVRWSYYAAGNVQSTPAVDSNGTVYFGSDLREPFPRQSECQCALLGRHGQMALFDRQRGCARHAARQAGWDGLHRIVQLQLLRDQPIRRTQEPEGQVHHLRNRFGGRGSSLRGQHRRLAEEFLIERPLGRAHGGLPQRLPERFGPRGLLQLPAAHLGAPVPAGQLQRRVRLVLRRYPPNLFTRIAPAPDGADHQSQPH